MNKLVIALLTLAAVLLTAAPTRADKVGADKSVADPAAAVAPERLTQGSLSAEEYAFKQKVYRLHVARGLKSGRPRVYDLSPSALATVPGTAIVMRRDAAAALGRLLAAARADLAADQAATGQGAETTDRHARAGRVEELALNNAYRSASTQFAIWDRNFAGYLAATRPQRLALPGGEFGEAAAALLRDYVGVRVAAPGFSNHQGGIAVDFALRLKPATTGGAGRPALGPAMGQADPWKESWFWRWLGRRAGDFGFVAYLPEPWHWEYLPDRVGKGWDG
jgi:hypothetical protein